MLLQSLLNLILHGCQSSMFKNQVSMHKCETGSAHKPCFQTIDHSLFTFLCLRLYMHTARVFRFVSEALVLDAQFCLEKAKISK